MRRESLHDRAQEIADQLDREETAGGGHDVANEPRVPKGNSDGGQWTSGVEAPKAGDGRAEEGEVRVTRRRAVVR